MQLEIDAIKKAAAWPGADRCTLGERGTAVPLMGPAGHGSASPLMGPATAGTISPLMGPAAPATVTPLLGPADHGTMVSLMGPADPGHGHAADAPKPVMARSDRRTDLSPGPAAVRQAGPGEPSTLRPPTRHPSDPQVVRRERRSRDRHPDPDPVLDRRFPAGHRVVAANGPIR